MSARFGRKLDAEKIAAIVQLREVRKWSATRIARRYNVSTSAVNYQLLRNGVDPWDASKTPSARNGGAFSAEEDARMLQLGRDGLSPWKISQAMNRPKTSVLIRLLTLEVRAENALERAA